LTVSEVAIVLLDGYDLFARKCTLSIDNG